MRAAYLCPQEIYQPKILQYVMIYCHTIVPVLTIVTTTLQSTNIRGMSSEAFDQLLDRQIAEVEESKMRESLASAAFIDPMPGGRYGKFGLPLGGLFGSSKSQHSQDLNNSGKTLLDDDEDEFDAFFSAPQGQAKASTPIQQQATSPMAPLSYGRPNTTTPPIGSLHRPTSSASGSMSGSGTHSRNPSRTSTVVTMSQNNTRNSRPSTPSLGNVPIAPLLPPPPGSRPVSLNNKSGQGMSSLMGSIDLLNDFGSNSSAPLAAPAPVPAFAKGSAISPLPSKNQNQANLTQFESLFDLGLPPSSSSPAMSPIPARTPLVSPTPTGGSQWSLPKPGQPNSTSFPTTTKVASSTTGGGLSAQDLSFFEGL
jgi:hypothetical protein